MGVSVGKEIRKETDWLGNEKEVVYENNEKVGEIRNETTFWGTEVKREYNPEGERVSETRHKQTFFGRLPSNHESDYCLFRISQRARKPTRLHRSMARIALRQGLRR
jgi:hypothetical protein